MKWKKFTLTTTTEAVDLISYTLDELGIEGIEIEDNIPLTEKETKGMFIDILPELPPDEGVAKVSFYLDEDDDIPAMMAKVKEALEELKKYDTNDIYVIGGESIYRQLLPYCDVAHVTCMDYSYQADTWFPNLDEDAEWVVAADSEEKTYFDLEYCFKMYVRKTKLKEIVDLLK